MLPRQPVLPTTVRRSGSSSKLSALADFDSAMNAIFSRSANVAAVSLSPVGPNGAHRRNLLLAAGCIVLLALFLLPSLFSKVPDGSLRACAKTFRIGIIADLDKKSKFKPGDKEPWHSIYMTGTLRLVKDKYAVEWDAPADVYTAHNEAGRGCELSELVLFNNKLLTFDDRTGIMFEIANYESSEAAPANRPTLVPRQLFMEGDGATDKGLKVEWATVKDGSLYVGSFGKEFTDSAGNILHANNLWVKAMSDRGAISHVNWKVNYDRMRSALGFSHPAYLLHETVTWSPVHKQWFVLPRRMSQQPYDEVLDESMGANTIIQASPDFSVITSSTVGRKTPVRGFSSAKFLPRCKDSLLLALKSEENSVADTQTSYLTLFQEQPDGSWATVMDEVEIPGHAKFEGLEVLDR